MRRYTSGYLHTNRAFVIQNLPPRRVHPKWTPILKVVLNILQRGNPTPLSLKLAGALGLTTQDLPALERVAFLSPTAPVWRHTIRGDETDARYPAQQFFDQWLPDALGADRAAMWLIRPETPISDICQREHKDFFAQQVDFYVPAARLVIEIDGNFHEERVQLGKDDQRDNHLKRYGIRTERIKTKVLGDKSPRVKEVAELILDAENVRETLAAWHTAALDRDLNKKAHDTIAALRLQVLFTELLLASAFDFDSPEWQLQLRSDEPSDYGSAALDDLLDLLEPLALLTRIQWKRPAIGIRALGPTDSFDRDKGCCIDLSISKSWTDEYIDAQNVIFCRSEYITRYGDQSGQWHDADYFQIESDGPIQYELREEADKQVLEKLLFQLFGYEHFREGQWPILDNILRRNPTVGVLPTGGGKSLCYQLPALLQPGVTIIVSPLRSLMRDQVAELRQFGIDRAAAISSEFNATEKERRIHDFAAGRTQILFVSPERFQTKTFRQACLQTATRLAVQHAVVDEVHCLSEWGHDFRTAYLNLGNAFRKLFPKTPAIGLTATASQNALTDIQLEFAIPDEYVFYRLDLKRPNLHFSVIHIEQSHQCAATHWIETCLSQAGQNNPSGIVFTPHVNGDLGCYDLAARLKNRLRIEVGMFPGKKPHKFTGSEAEFEAQKWQTQDAFKNGGFRLLCATKAFGMGVNKKDVRFTMHLGVPASMEALYQEAGRAGRDGEDADCIILATPPDKELLEKAFNHELRPDQLRDMVTKAGKARNDSDLLTQLWLLTNNLVSLEDEVGLLVAVLDHLQQRRKPSISISARQFGVTPETLEKAIYRLCQLGYVSDWTIEDFIVGRYVIDFEHRSDEQTESTLLSLMRKYQGERQIEKLEDICKDDSAANHAIFGHADRPRRITLLFALCHWCFRHFNYSRRQSMKSVFELCEKYPSIGQEEFRNKLENFFTINKHTILLRQFIDTGLERIQEWGNLLWPKDPKTVDRRQHVEQLRGMITRLLESYQSNIALDILSAAVRLLLGEYDDLDGSGRLRKQLQSSRLTPEDQDRVLDFIIEVAKKANSEQQQLVARDIIETMPGRDVAIRVHNQLVDSYSALAYLDQFSVLLKNLTDRIEDGLASRRTHLNCTRERSRSGERARRLA